MVGSFVNIVNKTATLDFKIPVMCPRIVTKILNQGGVTLVRAIIFSKKKKNTDF